MKPEEWQRVKEILEPALELDPGSRSAFVDRACAGDDRLRREVQSLIAQHNEAAGQLELPALEMLALTEQRDPSDEGTLPHLTGKTIAHYEILERVGAGGMGVVYKARDLHLDRFVALKVLPPGKVADENAKRRFMLEARAASALNHPNIVTVHDIAEEGGLDFIVMEFVSGKPMDQLIGRKGLKLRDTLKYGFQIADALAAAHIAGIVHRDLKPGNIMVTEAGLVKVLDFGLAKLARADNPLALTQTGKQTEEGVIVGTVAYMSPEQAEGKPVDARSDIFSFGSVLYEMITGHRAFHGDSKIAILSAIIEKDPQPLSTLSGQTPIELEKLVSRCLRKDRDRRLQHMGDIKLALAELREESDSGALRTTTLAKAPRRRWPLVASLGITLALAAIIALWFLKPAKPVSRSEWVQVTNLPDPVSQPALSPDGRMVTFVRGLSTFAAAGQIYVKILPDGDPVQLTRDDLQKMSPVFSPDSSKIAYTVVPTQTQWDTWVVPVLGGQPQLWLPNASGLGWSEKGKVLFSEIKNNDLHMAIVAADESRANQHDVYIPPGDIGMAHRSYSSPDGRWVLIAEMDRGVWLPCRLVPMSGNSAGREVGPPVAGCTFAAWSPDGKWMYLSSNAGGFFHIWRQRFPDGQPEQITSGPGDEEGIAMAPDGKSFITAAGVTQSAVWIHESDNEERQVSLEGYSYDVKFTPDGKKLCYRILKGSFPASDPSELRVLELDSGRSLPLLPGFPVTGKWGTAYDISPDGQKVAVAAPDREGKYRLWIAPLDRRSAPYQIPDVEALRVVFAPSGEIFFRAPQGNSSLLYRIHEDGTGLRRAVNADPPGANPLAVSPDGKWLLARTGFEGPAVMAYPLAGGVPVPLLSQKACPGDPKAKWSADGRFLVMSIPTTQLGSTGRTYFIPVPPGRSFPEIPAGGFQSEADILKVPGARRVDLFDVAAGPKAGMYAFARESIQRNLFRVPLR